MCTSSSKVVSSKVVSCTVVNPRMCVDVDMHVKYSNVLPVCVCKVVKLSVYVYVQ